MMDFRDLRKGTPMRVRTKSGGIVNATYEGIDGSCARIVIDESEMPGKSWAARVNFCRFYTEIAVKNGIAYLSDQLNEDGELV